VGLKASEAAAEWQARLLAAGVDWSNPEAQQVLQRVAAAHLQGLLLLQGGTWIQRGRSSNLGYPIHSSCTLPHRTAEQVLDVPAASMLALVC
jgi:hypothetical protein